MNTPFARLVVAVWVIAGIIAVVVGGLSLENWSQLRWVQLPDFAVMFAGRWLAVVSGGWLLFHLVIRRKDDEVLIALLAGSAGMAIAERSAAWGFLFLASLVWSVYKKRWLEAGENRAGPPPAP